MKKQINLMIVDDHQFLIDGIKSQLNGVAHIKIIAEASNGKEALMHHHLQSAHVVLMDLEMPVMNAFTTIPILLKKHPACKIIILTSYDEKALVNKAVELGAKGYILKNISRDILIKAIETVDDGACFFSDEVTISQFKTYPVDSNVSSSVPEVLLSPREKEIMTLIATGFSNSEMAQTLYLSIKTIETHRNNMMKKIGAKNVAGVIRYALNYGIIKK